MTDEAALVGVGGGRGWRKAAGLFLLVVLTSAVSAGTLVSVPFVVLVVVAGARDARVLLLAAAALLITLAGPRDAFWFAERGWALIVGGTFAAVTLGRPRARLTTRALTAVVGAVAIAAGYFLLRTGSWSAIDWSMTDRLQGALATWIDAMAVLREGEPVSPALVSAIYRTIELHGSVFPALVALESMAALGVAWWLYVRMVHDDDRALGSMGDFRFNDHLVWVLIVGFLLVVASLGSGVTRVGANLAVFMCALYAVRGMGVVLFVSGGLSLFGYSLFAFGILFFAPIVLGLAVMLGVADTWLDLRERVGESTA